MPRAVVANGDGAQPVVDDPLQPYQRAAVNAHLASYKLPRTFVAVDEIVRSPSGKADYRWAKQVAGTGG